MWIRSFIQKLSYKILQTSSLRILNSLRMLWHFLLYHKPPPHTQIKIKLVEYFESCERFLNKMWNNFSQSETYSNDGSSRETNLVDYISRQMSARLCWNIIFVAIFIFSFLKKYLFFNLFEKRKKQTHNFKWIDFVFHFYSVERSFSWENYIWLAGWFLAFLPKSRDVKKYMVWLRFCWDFFSFEPFWQDIILHTK